MFKASWWLFNFPYVTIEEIKLIRVYFCTVFYAVSAQHTTCERSYYKLGCYQDRRWARTMSQLLITDRDPSSSKYGKSVDWHDWENYLHGFVISWLELSTNNISLLYNHTRPSRVGGCLIPTPWGFVVLGYFEKVNIKQIPVIWPLQDKG